MWQIRPFPDDCCDDKQDMDAGGDEEVGYKAPQPLIVNRRYGGLITLGDLVT
jgi:hypothetical protein